MLIIQLTPQLHHVVHGFKNVNPIEIEGSLANNLYLSTAESLALIKTFKQTLKSEPSVIKELDRGWL
ncbi:hypothetical protein AV654_03935 [Paenibacillus elgii]|uniref:Uncharacterized protein n=1 Tax=Paenibacillus elgii TaxID=189691 RepID=A0A161S448_9BACL|nr:hypothetical protein [Paenibacillus elgii]KZE73735.1 hypothetical protein AV654_03935 [Paenibacillus elgii]MCM3269524.1 hypothetical protein [Paenibacillus elgii]